MKTRPRAAWPVDRCLKEGPVRDQRGDLVVQRWHRTVSPWVTELLRGGFAVQAMVEPMGTAPVEGGAGAPRP